MLVVFRAGLLFITLAILVYCFVHLVTMTRFFDKARRKRILRRTIFGLIAVAVAGLTMALILTLLN